jgi:ATP-dependent helicase/nuclease subunit A
LTQLELESAGKPLDWLLPAVFMLPADKVCWANETEARPAGPLFEIHTYPRAVTDQWRIPPVADTSRSEMLERLADLKTLPADEPVAGDEAIEPILRALEYTYPGLELTTLPARVGVTELKRRWDAIQDPEQRPLRDRSAAMTLRPVFLEPAASPTAAERGIATHRFLQLVDLRRPCDGDDLQRQREDMVQQGRLTAEEADLVMLDDAAWFFGTDLGRRLRAEIENVEREVAFVSRVPPERLDPTIIARDEHDVVLLRGMVDVVLDGPQGLEIIDYKTDDVSADKCGLRAAAYRSQMDSYAEAIGRIYRREVRRRHLVFLTARQVVAST